MIGHDLLARLEATISKSTVHAVPVGRQTCFPYSQVCTEAERSNIIWNVLLAFEEIRVSNTFVVSSVVTVLR